MDFVPEIVELEEQHALAMRGDVSVAELPEFFGTAFTAVVAAVEEAGLTVVGPPFGYYPVMPTDVVIIEAGFPVSTTGELSGDVHRLVLPGGPAVVAVHVGPYDTMVKTYTRLQAWMEERDLIPASGMWESYLSDPTTDPDPSTWRTQIVWPVLGATD